MVHENMDHEPFSFKQLNQAYMQRRQFLFSSGILASAITFSPSSVLAGDKEKKTGMVIIHETGSSRDMIHAVIKNSFRDPVPELAVEEIGELKYTSNGFLLKMKNGKIYRSEKIVFSSCNNVIISRGSVHIRDRNGNINLVPDTANDKNVSGPEFWSFSTAKKFDGEKIMPFIKRDKHAFLCIS
jgi:hypothetical protein